jgi:type I restriction enzyme S subunit
MSTVEGWASCPLGNLVILQNNKAKQVKSTEYTTVGSYPIVDQSSDFICGYHDDSTKVIDTNLPITVFGDHTRHTKFIYFPFIAGADGTQLLKSKQEIEDKFFYYLVSLAAEKIGNFGYDRHFKHLKEFLCDFPTSKPEQTKIAEILSTVDRAIEQTEALIAKQQRIKTGLMQDLLTRGIDEHGNLRSEQTHEFKDSPLGRIPVEWGRRSIRSLGAGHPSTVQTGPFGAQLHAEDYVEDGVPLLLIRNLQDGRIDVDGMPRVREADATRLSRYALQPGDVVFSRVGRVGSCFLVEPEHDGWLISGQLLRVRMVKDVVDNRYLYRALASKYAQDHIAGASVGTTRTSINTQILESLEILVPTDRHEQAKIAEVLLTADQALKQMEALLAKQQRIKTSLMQDLLTGKKRVTALLNDMEVVHG